MPARFSIAGQDADYFVPYGETTVLFGEAETKLVSIGVGAGLISAGLFTRALQQLLFRVDPIDPLTFAGAPLVILLVAAFAAYVPTRRGMRPLPMGYCG